MRCGRGPWMSRADVLTHSSRVSWDFVRGYAGLKFLHTKLGTTCKLHDIRARPGKGRSHADEDREDCEETHVDLGVICTKIDEKQCNSSPRKPYGVSRRNDSFFYTMPAALAFPPYRRLRICRTRAVLDRVEAIQT